VIIYVLLLSIGLTINLLGTFYQGNANLAIGILVGVTPTAKSGWYSGVNSVNVRIIAVALHDIFNYRSGASNACPQLHLRRDANVHGTRS
jgi:hypothetical protein